MVGQCQGKPTSSSWNFPSHGGSQDCASQPERHKHSHRAVYRKQTASLLYLASIKGNSAENFLEGVMRLTHTQKHTLPTSTPIHSLTQKHKTHTVRRDSIYTCICINTLRELTTTVTPLFVGLAVNEA